MNSKPSLTRYLPFLQWVKQYRWHTLSDDLIAAVIVTVMLIPQSLAYAMLAGLPPVTGLYASIGPLVVYALLGSSRTLSVGPVAIVSLLTATALGQIAIPGSAEYIAYALVLALLSGLILFVLGVLRLGFLANLLSHPVISGFITASGILIAVSQLKDILGISAKGHTLFEMIQALAADIQNTHISTLLLGATVIAFLLYSRSRLKSVLIDFGLPATFSNNVSKFAPAVAVLVSTSVVAFFGLQDNGVEVVGKIPGGLPGLTIPAFDIQLWPKLLTAALLISIIGFVESVSVGQTLAAKRRQRIDPDQELIGLGGANLAAAFTGGLPVTGGFSRSVVNFDAGAQTPFAGVLTAIAIALSTLYLTDLFQYLPIATLAATIIVAVLSLIDPGAIKRTWVYSKTDFFAMFLTIAVTLAAGVEPGIITGVVTSLLLHIWKTSKPHIAIVGRIPGTEHFRNIERHHVETNPKVLSLRVDESLYFANTSYLENRIFQLVAENPDVKHVVLMCSGVNEIDGSALESLEAINNQLKETGVVLNLSEVKGPVSDQLHRSAFFEELAGCVFLSQHDAESALTS